MKRLNGFPYSRRDESVHSLHMLGERSVWTVIVRSWFVIWTCDNAIQGVKLLKKPLTRLVKSWVKNMTHPLWKAYVPLAGQRHNVTPHLAYKTGSQRIKLWEAATNANSLISLGYRISDGIKVYWRELFNTSPDNSAKTGSLQKHLVVFCEACLFCQRNYCMAEWTNCVPLTKTNRVVRVKCCVPRPPPLSRQRYCIV